MKYLVVPKPDKERTESIYKSLYLSFVFSVCLSVSVWLALSAEGPLGRLSGASWAALGVVLAPKMAPLREPKWHPNRLFARS